MKKLYTIALVGLISVSIGNSTAKADTLFTKDLYFGIQGDSEVTKLQEFLTDQNIYSGPITGNFFSLTLAGVKSFQTREGVTPSAGYFGPLTRAKANMFLSPQLIASEQQAVLETGSTTTVPLPPKTTNDVVNSLQTQINLLLQQIQLLQQQLSTQQQTQQTIQQQQQILQQIQQNITPPLLITNIAVSEITESSAVISWTTNEEVVSRLEYGRSDDLLESSICFSGVVDWGPGVCKNSSVINISTWSKENSHKLNGLDMPLQSPICKNYSYYYQVIVKNAAGNERRSGILSFWNEFTPPAGFVYGSHCGGINFFTP